MSKAEHKEPDLSLLGKFVYYYPPVPSDNTIGPAPLPNADGTPHPATIYNIRAPVDDADSETVLVDLAVDAHGARYRLESIELFDKDVVGRPVAVFPEDNKKWVKAVEDERERLAKAEAARVKAAEGSSDEHYTRGDLDAMNKSDLCDLADGLGAEVDLHMTKDEIVAAILKAQRAAAKAAA